MKLSILGARLIDTSCNFDAKADIYIENGKIISLDAKPSNWQPDAQYNAEGLVATAGFIDIGTNLGANKDALTSETNAALAGGYTSLAIAPITSSFLDNAPLVQSILEKTQTNINLIPIAGITKGLEGKILTDMGALKSAACVGVSNMRYKYADLNIMSLAFKYAKGMDLKVFLYPEDADLKNNGVVHQGKISMRMGLDSIPVSAETISLSRDLILIQETGIKSHFCGISAAASLDILQHARELGIDFSLNVSLANLLYTHNQLINYDTNFHLEPPLRTSFDRDELLKAVESGQIEVIASGHTPIEIAYKNAPFAQTKAGMATLETAFAMGYSLVLANKLSLHKFIAALTNNPAQVLDLQDKGHLQIGACADISLLDLNKKWTPNIADWQSFGTNNPLFGTELTGKVVATFVAGNLKYSDSEKFIHKKI